MFNNANIWVYIIYLFHDNPARRGPFPCPIRCRPTGICGKDPVYSAKHCKLPQAILSIAAKIYDC